jgi:hypothetical protein
MLATLPVSGTWLRQSQIEALFRDWLEQFLPAKYGVTSGYIIQQKDAVKPRSALKGKLRHYDVIIYNKLDSSVLWTEMSPGRKARKPGLDRV